MNKATLNQQIIYCRPMIKRARVCTIRKVIKRVKELKAWKKESEKEKKLKKADRLVKKVMIMKKMPIDEVTKFALINENLDAIVKKTKSDSIEHICALIAQHKDVQKKIQSIRNTYPVCIETLKGLLKTLGERSKLKRWKRINNESTRKSRAVEGPKLETVETLKPKVEEPQKSGSVETKVLAKKTSTAKRIDKPPNIDNECDDEAEVSQPPKQEKKMDDLFFISKKVTVPKLLCEADNSKDTQPQPRNNYPNRLHRRSEHRQTVNQSEEKPWNKIFKGSSTARPPQVASAPPAEEKLHPSWAAKKMPMMKPFEGTKIKFDVD